MGLERDTYLDADDMTVSVTQSLLDVQAPSHDDADEYEDGCAVLREAVQVTSHGRVVSSAVQELPVSIHGESTRARAAAGLGRRGTVPRPGEPGGGCRVDRACGCRG